MMLDASPFLGRTCADCIRFVYDDDGKVMKERRSGQPWRRPLGVLTPCYKCPKIPEDAPEKSYYYAVEITETSWQAIRHYDRCKATGHFPVDPETGEVDPIVQRNAEIISTMREAHREAKQAAMMMQALQLAGLRAAAR